MIHGDPSLGAEPVLKGSTGLTNSSSWHSSSVLGSIALSGPIGGGVLGMDMRPAMSVEGSWLRSKRLVGPKMPGMKESKEQRSFKRSMPWDSKITVRQMQHSFNP